MDLTEKTIRNAWWQFITTVFLAAIQLISTAVLARYLTPPEFGLMAIATIVFGFVTIFSEVGIGSALIRLSQINTITLQTGFLVSMITSSFVFIVVWISAPSLAHFFQNENASKVIRIVSLSFLISGWGVVSQSMMERELEFKRLMVIKMVALTVSSVVGVWLAMIDYGVWALVISLLTNALFKTVLLYVFKPHSIGFKTDTKMFWSFINYSIGLTVSRTFQYGAQQADNIIVGRWMGTEMLGLYGKAFQLMILPVTYLGQTIDKVTYPGISIIKDNIKRLNDVHIKAIALVNLVMIPFGAAAILTAKEIVLLLLGPDWLKITFTLQILLLTVSFRTSVRMVDSLIRAVGAVYKGAFRNLIMFIMIMVGCLFAKEWGISSVAAAASSCYLINYIMMTQLALKLIGGSWRQILKALLPGIYMAIAILAISYPLVEALRDYDAPAAVILLAVTIVSSMLYVFSYLKYPAILGEAGIWIRTHVAPLIERVRR